MHDFAPLIKDLAIMLSLAGIVTILFQRIRQPVILGYLIAGMILGPHTPPHLFITDLDNIHILSELGVIFLMFYLGLEFSFKKLARLGVAAVLIGVVEVILMIAIGYATGMLLGYSRYDAIFLGAALSVSSTTIIVKAIEELKLKTRRFAELIVAVLVVEDLLAILLLAALSTFVISKNLFSMTMAYAAGKLFIIIGAWFFAGYFLVPPIFKKISHYISQETLTIISVALCLLLVWSAASLKYSPALGAFIMGSILSETTVINRIERSIRPIRDIFAAVFFITVGMQIDPRIILEHWQIVLLLSLITIFGKLLTTFFATFVSGQSLNTALRVGFSMAQVGEFSFIIISLGLMLNVVSDTIYPIIVAVASVTAFTTPYLIRFSGFLVNYLNTHLSENTKYALDAYAAWVYRFQLVSPENKMLRAVLIRIAINAFLIAIIFSLVHFAAPRALSAYPERHQIGNGILFLLALSFSLPFIWGMLFSYQKIKTQRPLFIIVVRLFVLVELLLLSIFYFQSWIALFLFLGIAMILMWLLYRQFEYSYHWFERQLLTNIANTKGVHPKYSELAPWDTHLVEIEVGDKSIFVGNSLSDHRIREDYNVNIVAIARGSRIIAAPRGEDHIHAHDKLILLGNDDQIDQFRKAAEIHTHKREIINFLDHFKLRPYYLDEGNPLIGKTIRNSKIRERLGAIIVGLERNNERILNPSLDMVLKVNDLLLIVGEAEKFYLLFE